MKFSQPSILCDGKNLSIGINGGSLYTMSNPIVTSVSLSLRVFSSDMVEITAQMYASGLRKVEEFDFWQDKSVTELLQVIQKKIESRDA